MTGNPRLFDLNIKRILEAWNLSHAVREIIANALDETILSRTKKDVSIEKDGSGAWIVRDYGRGLRHENLTQNENPEKLAAAGRVIGKFGIGLKDAVGTLTREGIKVEIQSKHSNITFAQLPKHGFESILTLHGQISAPTEPTFTGTSIRFVGLNDTAMAAAKAYFLKFSAEKVLDQTPYGQILDKSGSKGRIYVAGLLIAEEEKFAFSYNITSLTEPMKRALNRERTNVGRSAYADRIKAMLLKAKSPLVAEILAQQLAAIALGTACDEVAWKEVAVHACKILNASGNVMFVTSEQLMENASAIDQARADGKQIITISESIQWEIAGAKDINGAPIQDLGTWQKDWNASFQFELVDPQDLSLAERSVFDKQLAIASIVGGIPKKVRAVKISTTMRPDFSSNAEVVGVWDPEERHIVIRRDQLRSLEAFSATLLHEIAHARSDADDITRDFENELTRYLGKAAIAILRAQS